MLQNLHVKNIALIEEVDIDFSNGLNIISGETGAGKSLLLGSLNIALGSRMTQDLIRHGEKEALVELVFNFDDERIVKFLKDLDIGADEDTLIISRRFASGRTVSRINGVAVTAADIKKAGSLLLDIHGQHENQSLLYPEKQLSIIDSFGGDGIREELIKTGTLYARYKDVLKELEAYDLDEGSRLREASLLEYEINEIRTAAVREGEEEELEQAYRKMSNAKNILEAIETVRASLSDDSGAAGSVGRAIRELSGVLRYDDGLSGISDMLSEAESLISDVNREISAYMEDLDFSEQELADTEKRLDLIHSMTAKYGGTADAIEEYALRSEERLEFLKDYETRIVSLKEKKERIEGELAKACRDLTSKRKKAADAFSAEVVRQLYDLNFNKVGFEVSFSETENYRADGTDSISFDISLNPGEPLRPLSKVASGGELSRIMLAIRTLLADKDSTGTLIFDEIDTGISGVTAQKVAEKMAVISRSHQLICVTHLAQIAAMADANYIIEKASDDDSTKTSVRALSGDEAISELSRLLGGDPGSGAASANARDLKERACSFKSENL